MTDNIVVLKNGKEAFDYLNDIVITGKNLPELILLDINMPIWDAWQFLDEYPKLMIPEKIKIYLLTSSICKEDREKAEEYGLKSNYIIKPLAIEKIKEILELKY